MMLIQSEREFNRFLPNAFATAEGESSIYEKSLPWIEQAETWVAREFVTPNLMPLLEGEARYRAMAVVALEAIKNAIPMLDLVLTPNGFGIVSNQNVAPASADRVNRLIERCGIDRDNAIDALIVELYRLPQWQGTEREWHFSATFFSDLDLARRCGGDKHLYVAYCSKHGAAVHTERKFARRFVSPELIVALRKEYRDYKYRYAEIDADRLTACRNIMDAVASVLNGDRDVHYIIEDTVQLFRDHPDKFPEWHGSATAELWNNPAVFENKKSAHGYFF